MPEATLKAFGLTKRFGGVHAVSDVAIDVHRDEIHAVIGPNGAGKSTLVNLLSGELAASAGTILLSDEDITRLAPDRRARAGLGRAYQKTTIFQRFTVHENVRLAAQARGGASLRPFRAAKAEAEVRERTQAALARAGLSERQTLLASQLSHGEQRQLEIAMVLATDPAIVLLDEPLAGMGQAEARIIIALIATLKEGRAILLVEHDMDAVFALADRLTVMYEGRVIARGLPQDVRRHPAVREAYLGGGPDAP